MQNLVAVTMIGSTSTRLR